MWEAKCWSAVVRLASSDGSWELYVAFLSITAVRVTQIVKDRVILIEWRKCKVDFR